MARIDGLPAPEIIKGLKGTLDFVEWRGIFYVRSWPITPRSSLSPAHFTRANLFGAIIQAYPLLASVVTEAYRLAAEGSPRTARDLHVSAVLGHLHEASMSDFLTLLQEAVDALNIIAQFADPQNILPGFYDRYAESIQETSTGATFTEPTGTPVPAGEAWIIQLTLSRHNDTTNRELSHGVSDGSNYGIMRLDGHLPQWEPLEWQGAVILKEGDYVKASGKNIASGRKVFLDAWGLKFKIA